MYYMDAIKGRVADVTAGNMVCEYRYDINQFLLLLLHSQKLFKTLLPECILDIYIILKSNWTG